MAAFNSVILVGNLTADPELRYTPKGTAVTECRLAINRHWTDEAGEKKEAVCFVPCKAFGKTAENIAKFVRKGHPMLIEGRLDMEEWQDKKSGENRQKLTVLIATLQFLKNKDAAPQ